jgi:hypothetical protein
MLGGVVLRSGRVGIRKGSVVRLIRGGSGLPGLVGLLTKLGRVGLG